MIEKITKSYLVILLSKINIKDIITLFIKLEQKGHKFFALCPFHSEKTPSFFVDVNKQRYYCFGCHKSGDIIQFLINYKKITFYDAVQFLSKFTQLENKLICHNVEKDLLDEAANFYSQNIKEVYFNNTKVRDFFIKRCIPFDIIKRFNLGFAKDSWNFILKNLSTSNAEKKKLLNNGLIIEKNSRFYDRFRNRIIFPIKSISGKIVAFGGRVLDDNIKPKYINSPETYLFSKKKTLYGLYEAMCFNKSKSIIIVEGYFDVITLHKYGITNVAAILGSFFSKEHFKMLSLSYDHIVFCYDNDTAGNFAAIRTAYSCLSYLDLSVIVSFIFLPRNSDPDSFLTSGHKNKFLSLLNNPVYILDYIFDNLCFNLNFNTLKEKVILFNRLNNLLKHISNTGLKKIIFNHFLCLLETNKATKKNAKIKKNISKDTGTSLGMKACFFLLKNKKWVSQIDIKKLILNKKISFHSDIYIFFELVILLKNNIHLELNELNKMLRKKININNFFELLDCLPENILKDEFFSLIDKISSIDIIEN